MVPERKLRRSLSVTAVLAAVYLIAAFLSLHISAGDVRRAFSFAIFFPSAIFCCISCIMQFATKTESGLSRLPFAWVCDFVASIFLANCVMTSGIAAWHIAVSLCIMALGAFLDTFVWLRNQKKPEDFDDTPGPRTYMKASLGIYAFCFVSLVIEYIIRAVQGIGLFVTQFSTVPVFLVFTLFVSREWYQCWKAEQFSYGRKFPYFVAPPKVLVPPAAHVFICVLFGIVFASNLFCLPFTQRAAFLADEVMADVGQQYGEKLSLEKVTCTAADLYRACKAQYVFYTEDGRRYEVCAVVKGDGWSSESSPFTGDFFGAIRFYTLDSKGYTIAYVLKNDEKETIEQMNYLLQLEELGWDA